MRYKQDQSVGEPSECTRVRACRSRMSTRPLRRKRSSTTIDGLRSSALGVCETSQQLVHIIKMVSIWLGIRVGGLPVGLEKVGRRILRMVSMGCFRVRSQWQRHHVEHGRAAGEPQHFFR